jgi:hypothetical protein
VNNFSVQLEINYDFGQFPAGSTKGFELRCIFQAALLVDLAQRCINCCTEPSRLLVIPSMNTAVLLIGRILAPKGNHDSTFLL